MSACDAWPSAHVCLSFCVCMSFFFGCNSFTGFLGKIISLLADWIILIPKSALTPQAMPQKLLPPETRATVYLSDREMESESDWEKGKAQVFIYLYSFIHHSLQSLLLIDFCPLLSTNRNVPLHRISCAKPRALVMWYIWWRGQVIPLLVHLKLADFLQPCNYTNHKGFSFSNEKHSPTDKHNYCTHCFAQHYKENVWNLTYTQHINRLSYICIFNE